MADNIVVVCLPAEDETDALVGGGTTTQHAEAAGEALRADRTADASTSAAMLLDGSKPLEANMSCMTLRMTNIADR